ncbi:cadherin-like domain-containing protein, partial [Ahrensia sp. R2A130]|uniref:cadherin-like domain-containing protein n=1 Tax=Ahrensia sp. R2A130 TaxID=744979 RepID=UPI0001E0C347
MSDDLTTPAKGHGETDGFQEGATLGEIKGLVQTATEGGFVYKIPGSSADFGWKLQQGGSGLVWTDGSYFVLENCVGLSFDDRDVSPSEMQARAAVESPEMAMFEDAPAPVASHPHDLQRDIAAAISEQSLGFGHDPANNARPVRISEEKFELPPNLIPPQLDEIGAEVSFDIGTFLQENMLKGEATVHLQGLPSGLGYNAARMRVEGRIADDVMTGVPYTVGLTIQLATGAKLTSNFSWTIRDTQAIDQSETGSSVVPMLAQRDDGVSAGILFAIAGQSLRVSSAFGLERLNSSSSTAAPAGSAAASSGLFPIDPVSTGSVSASGQENGFSLTAATAAGTAAGEDDSEGDSGIDVQVAASGGTSAARALADDEAEAAASKIESDQTPQLPVAVGGPGSNKNSLPFAGSGNALTVAEDIPRTGLNLLANAFDADGDVLSLQSVQAEFGTVIIQSNGTVDYVPPPNFNGEDTITYTVSDGRGGTDTATVILNVLPINDAPVGITSAAQTIVEDDSLSNFDVLAGATDTEGDTLLVSQTSAINGIAVVNANGNIDYTPFANFNGVDTVSYTISDGNGGAFVSQIDITVTAINDAPLSGSPSPVTTDEDISLFGIDVASFASDPDGDPVSVDPGSVAALNGVVSLDGTGRIDYQPNANFNGTDTISYTIVDGQGGSVSGTISVTVRSVNDAPIAAPTIARTTDEDQTVISIDVLSAASDVDGDALFVEAGSVSA